VSRTAAQVREEFIEFFRQRGHVFVPSSPVVPLDDPTLLFTNAGMNQFKPYFLGTQTPPHPRVANTQKCIRAGGKHNDLDDVGHDSYHHTFFEMLGNWSFGDYFKREAIAWAWELLTRVWGLDRTRLHVTYFGGDETQGLEPDLEARDLWAEVLRADGLDASHIHAGSLKDNFWEMGETGPCGPCSEIHIDLTPDRTGARLVNAGDARVIEIWNLVFIQFNRAADGKLTPLPARHVDTGMGFERVTAVLQGHNNNYATEVFVPLLQAIERISGHRYGAAGQAANRYAVLTPGNMQDEACRVIADHIRCLTFALTDGAVPDREGRGYVVRRILRRAVRFGWQYLGLHEPFLYRLVDTVVDTMGAAFPELRKNPQAVKELVREEEESFERTLDRGLALFAEAAEYARRHHHHEIRGEDAFRLHDTYGFPIDLTQVMAQEQGLTVDIGEYERLMEEARERARACARGFAAAAAVVPPELVAPFGPTDDAPKYVTDRLTAPVRAIVRCGTGGQPELVDRDGRLQPGESAGLVFDRTCFYAEAGGQVGDRGQISGQGLRFDVEGTQRIGDTVVHFGTLVQGTLAPGQVVELVVDPCRQATKRNHTATHVLNWALREVLGDHVQQKGSLVDHEKTRFDFSHPKALTPEEIERVERLVNERINARLPVYGEVVEQARALRIHGLRAVFGERYPDPVRVLSVGVPVQELVADPDNPRWRQVSVEFCGGTHVSNTGDIDCFVLASEEAVAKGIRRIVGLTGQIARLAAETGEALVEHAEKLRRQPLDGLPDELARIQNTLATATLPARHRIRLRRAIEELQKLARQQQKSDAAQAAGAMRQKVDELLARAEKHGDTSIVVAEMPAVPLDHLRMAADMVKQRCESAAVLLGVAAGPDKALLLAALTPDLVQKGLKAGDLVKIAAEVIDGSGGGPPTMAQAGGRNPAKLTEALAAGRQWVLSRLR
jgi:alanyl-tRNA synthetase